MSAATEWQVSYRWMGKRRQHHTKAASIDEAISNARAYQASIGRSIVILRATTIEAEASSVDAVRDIVSAVARRFGVSVADVFSESRDKNAAFARQLAMYIARHRLQLSYPRLARSFNRTDHTTAIHAVRKITAMINAGLVKMSLLSELNEAIGS